MIRIQYDVFVSNHYHFDDYAGVDSGGHDNDDINLMMTLSLSVHSDTEQL